MIVLRSNPKPDFLGDCVSRQDMHTFCDPLCFPDVQGAEWVSVEDGEACRAGDFNAVDWLYGVDDGSITLSDGTKCPGLPVQDACGNTWIIPCLVMDGETTISAAWVMDDSGMWSRQATALQSRLLEIASECHEMMHSQTASEMPLPAMAQWATELLCAAYRMTPQIIGKLGFLDERLAPAALWASCGITPDTLSNDGDSC